MFKPISEFNPKGAKTQLLTPRSQEAVARAGFVLDDLYFKSEATFAQPALPASFVHRRFEVFERLRAEKVQTVIRLREQLIAELKEQTAPKVSSAAPPAISNLPASIESWATLKENPVAVVSKARPLSGVASASVLTAAVPAEIKAARELRRLRQRLRLEARQAADEAKLRAKIESKATVQRKIASARPQSGKTSASKASAAVKPDETSATSEGNGYTSCSERESKPKKRAIKVDQSDALWKAHLARQAAVSARLKARADLQHKEQEIKLKAEAKKEAERKAKLAAKSQQVAAAATAILSASTKKAPSQTEKDLAEAYELRKSIHRAQAANMQQRHAVEALLQSIKPDSTHPLSTAIFQKSEAKAKAAEARRLAERQKRKQSIANKLLRKSVRSSRSMPSAALLTSGFVATAITGLIDTKGAAAPAAPASKSTQSKPAKATPQSTLNADERARELANQRAAASEAKLQQAMLRRQNERAERRETTLLRSMLKKDKLLQHRRIEQWQEEQLRARSAQVDKELASSARNRAQLLVERRQLQMLSQHRSSDKLSDLVSRVRQQAASAQSAELGPAIEQSLQSILKCLSPRQSVSAARPSTAPAARPTVPAAESRLEKSLVKPVDAIPVPTVPNTVSPPKAAAVSPVPMVEHKPAHLIKTIAQPESSDELIEFDDSYDNDDNDDNDASISIEKPKAATSIGSTVSIAQRSESVTVQSPAASTGNFVSSVASLFVPPPAPVACSSPLPLRTNSLIINVDDRSNPPSGRSVVMALSPPPKPHPLTSKSVFATSFKQPKPFYSAVRNSQTRKSNVAPLPTPISNTVHMPHLSSKQSALMKLIDAEQLAEAQRDRLLLQTENAEEAARLETIFGIERARAAARIAEALKLK